MTMGGTRQVLRDGERHASLFASPNFASRLILRLNQVISTARSEHYDHALIEKTRERGVLWLTLNNADQRNPLSSAMLAEITSSLDRV